MTSPTIARRTRTIAFSALALTTMLTAAGPATGGEAQDARQRFETARKEASASSQEYQEAAATCQQIAENDLVIKLLNEEIANRGRQIGELGLIMESIDMSGPTRHSNVVRDQKRTAHATQIALRDEQQEARRQLALRENARPGPAKRQKALEDRNNALRDLRDKVDELTKGVDGISKFSLDGLGDNAKDRKVLSGRIAESRSFLKQVRPILQPPSAKSRRK